MPINLLTTQQLAVRLGLASITLHIWRSKGVGLPFQKIGPRVFYRLEDVQAYERGQVEGLIEHVLVADQPLPKLRSMRKHVFGLGLLQVLLTLVIVTVFSLFVATLAPTLWKMEWQTALALSSAMAMSRCRSTKTFRVRFSKTTIAIENYANMMWGLAEI